MKVISIINHKGGVGKSTIATNLASYFANEYSKNNVLVGDFDVQQSTKNWLSLRPNNLKKINTWEIQNGKLQKPSKDCSHIIIDSPAGMRDNSLERLVNLSDKIIVPLKPGLFDILSTETFLEEIIGVINNSNKDIDLCVIGNMTDINTKSTAQLVKFISQLPIESPTNISNSQIYVHLVAHGLSVFDTKTNVFDNEKTEWFPLIKWIEK